MALIRGRCREETLRVALDAVGGQIDWRGMRRVPIKPNVVSGRHRLAATGMLAGLRLGSMDPRTSEAQRQGDRGEQ